MKVEQLARWVHDLDARRSFYTTYFDATSNQLYTNVSKDFTSYFLTFGPTHTRLELMKMPGIKEVANPRGFNMGMALFAVSVGGKEKVDGLTERLRKDGFIIYSEPRTTGGGYFESVLPDPEVHYLEISA